MRKRRVMQLVLGLSPGGTERLVIELCKRLASRIDAIVCCLDERGEWADELETRHIPVVALGRKPGFHPTLALQIAKLIRVHGIEVVHCHHYTPYIYGRLATAIAPAMLVFTEHGRLFDTPPSRRRRLVNPLLARLGGRVCAVSRDLRQHMVAEGFPPSKVQVVYNGIDPGQPVTDATRTLTRRQLGLAPDALVIGSVGRLDPVKNFGQLLRAHANIVRDHRSARLVIVGDGPERAALEALAAQLEVASTVRFAGYRGDARAILPAFDIYVNCSTYEGVSLTILEAMAAALPVVATSVGGNPEVVVDGETGLLAATHAADLALAINRLIEQAPRRREMGEAGRSRVQTHFLLARMVEDYAAAYRAPAAKIAGSDAPSALPAKADPMSVSDATRSTV